MSFLILLWSMFYTVTTQIEKWVNDVSHMPITTEGHEQSIMNDTCPGQNGFYKHIRVNTIQDPTDRVGQVRGRPANSIRWQESNNVIPYDPELSFKDHYDGCSDVGNTVLRLNVS